MKAHIVLAHPVPHSFNAKLAGISNRTLASAGYDISFSDLCRNGFDAVEGSHHYNVRKDQQFFHTQTEQRYNAEKSALAPEVNAEINNIQSCDLLVVHFPLWWFGAPAILKGWIDRVFVYGKVYTSTKRYDNGMCRGKKMVACVTTGASADSCAANGKEGDTKMHLWPLLFPFRYIGFDVAEPLTLHGIGGVAFIEGDAKADAIAQTSASRWADYIKDINDAPLIRYNKNSDFNETGRLGPDAKSFSPLIRHEKK